MKSPHNAVLYRLHFPNNLHNGSLTRSNSSYQFPDLVRKSGMCIPFEVNICSFRSWALDHKRITKEAYTLVIFHCIRQPSQSVELIRFIFRYRILVDNIVLQI